MKDNNIYIKKEALISLMERSLIAAGVPSGDAEAIAEVLIAADIRGIDSHGINRLYPIYIKRIKEGILNPVTKIDVVREGLATAVVDGNNGMGHVIGKYAMQLAIDKANIYGMGMTAARNSSHYGIAGYYGLMAAEAGMIGITGTNAKPSIAPTFGVENMLGTNPLTFVLPTDEAFPFFLDCATSTSQRGKIEVYDRLGKKVPDGWVIDSKGESLSDATKILEALTKDEAALTPLGGVGEENSGYKGYGYATVVEILSAALQGGNYMKLLSGIVDNKKVPYYLGHFFIAIKISDFIELDEFKKITGNILRELRASKKMPGADRIFTAGEKEFITMQEREIKGIPVNIELQAELEMMIKELKLTGFDKLFV